MNFLSELLGLDSHELTATHMASRAVFVFFASLIFLRIAGLRTFGKKSIFDQTTMLTIGAILGRSIVSDSPFLPSMLAALILVVLHRLTSYLTFKSDLFRRLITGNPVLLVKNGKTVPGNLFKEQITEDDILQSCRLNGQINDLENIKESYLEPSGKISIIKKKN